MKNDPLKSFGFTYEYEGSSFVFHIVAESAEEATAHLAAMAGAKCEGELKAVDCDTPPAPTAM